MKGNVTVEAALVFPFCFALIGVVCYLGVYSYHLAMLKLTAYEGISRSLEQRSLDDQKLEREIARLLEGKAEERALALEDIRVSIKVTKFYITAELFAVQKMIFSQPVRVKVTYQRTSPERMLRAAAAGRRKN